MGLQNLVAVNDSVYGVALVGAFHHLLEIRTQPSGASLVGNTRIPIRGALPFISAVAAEPRGNTLLMASISPVSYLARFNLQTHDVEDLSILLESRRVSEIVTVDGCTYVNLRSYPQFTFLGVCKLSHSNTGPRLSPDAFLSSKVTGQPYGFLCRWARGLVLAASNNKDFLFEEGGRLTHAALGLDNNAEFGQSGEGDLLAIERLPEETLLTRLLPDGVTELGRWASARTPWKRVLGLAVTSAGIVVVLDEFGVHWAKLGAPEWHLLHRSQLFYS